MLGTFERVRSESGTLRLSSIHLGPNVEDLFFGSITLGFGSADMDFKPASLLA